MERCPFCGASIRSGARFCTSCGRRLAGSTDEPTIATAPAMHEHGNGVDEPAKLAETDQAVPWESGPIAVDRTNERSNATSEDWSNRTPVASADLWPQSTRGGDEATNQHQPEPTTHAESASDDGPVGVPAWASSPWSSWSMPPTVDDVAEGAESPPPTAEMANQQADDAVMQHEDAPAAEMNAEAYGASLEERRADAVTEESPPPTAPKGGEAGRTPGDALGQAVALVDELRRLLPAIAGLEGVDVSGAIAVLGAARSRAGELPVRDIDALAATVEVARNRPREIDALLGLAGRLDELARTVSVFQELSGAVDEALGLLGAPPRNDADDRIDSDS